jgi:RNA polymerase sigma factor (sigma-70 family)
MLQSVSIQPPTDAELIQQFAKAGAQAAFEQLVDRHASWVFASAYRQLRDRHLAEDATQAVFLLLARKANAMKTNQKISGWLFNATQYTVKSILRAKRRQEKHERRKALTSGDPATLSSEISEYLDAAVAKLSVSDQAIVILRFYQGLDFGQIAASMNTTESAARRRLNRAIAKLRPSISAEALTASAMIGREALPEYLRQQLTQTAARHVASASVNTVANGAAHMMRIAQIKFAAICGAIGVVVAVSAAAVVSHTAANPQAVASEPAPKPASVATISQISPEVLQRYTLDPDQIVVYLKPPLPAKRWEFVHQINPDDTRKEPQWTYGMILAWDKGKLDGRMMMREGGPLRFADVVQYLLNMFPQEIEGDHGLLEQMKIEMPGDFVARQNAARQQLCTALGNILWNESNIPITLKLRTVARKVIVLAGRWNFKSVTHPRRNDKVEIYGKHLHENGGGNGDKIEFAKWLGQYINAQVVFEADGVPGNLAFGVSPEGNDASKSFDPEEVHMVLQHICEQTGLTWSEQTRNVERLFVEAQ